MACPALSNPVLYVFRIPQLQDMGPEHPVVAISLQTLGHVLRLRQQLDEALEVAKRCEALRRASSSQAQGPQMAAALYLQVCGDAGAGWCVGVEGHSMT
jgi:hypothetical protein